MCPCKSISSHTRPLLTKYLFSPKQVTRSTQTDSCAFYSPDAFKLDLSNLGSKLAGAPGGRLRKEKIERLKDLMR